MNREKEINMERHAPEYYDDSELVLTEMIDTLISDQQLKIDDFLTLDLHTMIADIASKFQTRYENYRK